MSSQPQAIIYGIHKQGAKKLAKLLVENSIKVVGVGEYVSGLSNLANIEIRAELSGEEKVNYVFDFEGDERIWRLALVNKAKLTIVGVNNSLNLPGRPFSDVNWRIVNAHGVYGTEMQGEEVDYFVKALVLAVQNKNLVLPPRDQELRLLSEEDVTEAIMRATFLSGTDEKIFEVWGKSINSEHIAKVLVEEAKMTRFKVLEGEAVLGIPNSEDVERVWRDLRWIPESDLTQSLTETLQLYFEKADEYSRKVKQEPSVPVKKAGFEPLVEPVEVDREVVPKRFEVEVESEAEALTAIDEVQNPNPLISAEDEISEEVEEVVEETVDDEPETVVRDEEEVYMPKTETSKVVNTEKAVEERIEKGHLDKLDKKESFEIDKIVIKNSNTRPVNEIVEEEESVLLSEWVKSAPVTPAKPAKELKSVNQRSRLRRKMVIPWKKIGVGVLGVMVAAIIISVGSDYLLVKKVYGLKQLINDKKYTEATELTKDALSAVRRREDRVSSLGLNRFAVGRRYQNVLKAADQSLLLSEKAIVIAQKGEVLNDAIFKEKEIDWNKNISELRKEVSEVETLMGVLSARLEGDWTWVPNRWRSQLNEYKKILAETRAVTSKGNKILEVLPEVLGTDGKRREYMVLMQNESELRPGGGFIGSYGILSFEGGKLLNFEIKDVYEADGQLKGHVEPPEQIKNYLGEAKWYMRDANWQADFTASARDIQWFLEKETGRKVDGVIGVDLAVAKGVLGVVGEVYVPDFKEKINKNNLYEQAEFYSETKFFPGSNQKASFLGGLGKQLFEEIKNLKGEERVAMVRTVIDLLEKNEVQMAFNNKDLANTMANMGWNGSVYEGKCGVDRCFADFLYVVEANLGVNKANYFLYRNIEQTVEIGEKVISRVVKINYENTSKNSSWPGGDYKNYMRIYLPASANLAEVSISDATNNGVKSIITGDNLKVNTVKGKKEVGVLVVVPVTQKRTVEIRYTDQVDLSGKDKFSYLHYVQKQPGYGDTGLVTLVTMPKDWQVNQVEPAASLMGDKLLFNQKLDRDIKMGVEIVK